MIFPLSLKAGSCHSVGMGKVMLPYERAIARVPERADEKAAPTVPDDRENAPEEFSI